MNLSEISKLTEDECRDYIESIVWRNGRVCPFCSGTESTLMHGKTTRPGLYKCKTPTCRKPFTVTMRTVMEDSHIPMRHWLMAFHLLCSSKKGFSAKQLERNLGIGSYHTAWFLLHRIRYAMESGSWKKPLDGIVEVDETYVGGKPRKGTGPHKRGRGTDKTPVMVLVEREGRAHSKVIEFVDGKTLKGEIRRNVEPGAILMTDDNQSYKGIGSEFEGGHHSVNHSAGEYARGGISTNTRSRSSRSSSGVIMACTTR